jgi:hypothetical protein
MAIVAVGADSPVSAKVLLRGNGTLLRLQINSTAPQPQSTRVLRLIYV